MTCTVDCPMCDGTGVTPYTRQPCGVCADALALVEKTRLATISACAGLFSRDLTYDGGVVIDRIRQVDVPRAPREGT